MQNWAFAKLFGFKSIGSLFVGSCLLTAISSQSIALGQVPSASFGSAETVQIAPEARQTTGRVLETTLAEGLQLETNSRWGEALSHYEEALREHRNHPVLKKRHDLAKLHYSLDRRYHDRSFRKSLLALSGQQALSLYSELLQKTSTHYVLVPAWNQLGSRGTKALEIALADPQFRSHNRLQLSAEQLSQLHIEMQQRLNRRPLNNARDLVTLAGEMARLVQARTGLSQTATLMEFVAAAANGLDNYSAYLTADQLREVYEQIEGNFVGLGVELKAEANTLLIVHVIPGSPAERAGILANDRIVAVDGKSTAELSTDEAASMLTGSEGSWVQVTAYTAGSQPRVLNIRRAHIEVPSLEGVKILDPEYGIAYIRIPTFQKTTARDLEAALWELHRKGMKSLILDLTGNPGGLLTSSVELADKFLTQGDIVSTRGRSAQEDFNYQAHYGGTWRVPLVVLIDGDSASASEIFAGAIKDNNRGTIVGTTSYGKGSVQGIFPLGYAGAGIRLTTAKFFSPNGTAISHHGVIPHEKVTQHAVAKPVNGSFVGVNPQLADAILQAGLRTARSRATARTTASARSR